MTNNLIKSLVQKYSKNREFYLSAEYNESQLRVDFLDPLFELLGWDIGNTQKKSTNEREVLLEEPLKADATSNTKKPDYTFRLFSERKFFLEAKKPNVRIKSDNESAKQLRRYGFTAKLKISVLSNFEHLAIYDCSQKIEKDDPPTKARIKIYHYTEYETIFDEIKQQLSHEVVYSGQFDETWKEIEDQLKLSSIDSVFLRQINDWRIILGKEVYSHNPTINEESLNDIVQNYLNSIIFLRVCEDRNLETYKTLLNFANNKDFNSLITKFKEADNKYNAELFNHALTEEIISNNSSAFWIIIKQLYFPESTYSFSVIASNILGNIYEIFLGEQLKIENGEILLQKKPENIDRDIITTPTFIIQDILRQTVVKYCENKSGEEILSSSFADIACGSGAFLLETYQLLHDILVDYYLINEPQKLIQTSVNTFKLPFNIKKQILQHCIFGVDKDFNAVEACKFGLLLKLLEDEETATITTPALPNLNKNIHFGNSLIDSSKTNSGNVDKINPFDFGEIKFDVIVGNPPYMATKHIKQLLPLEKPIYEEHYLAAYKQYDKYFLFIEQGIKLLKNNGYLGLIVPSKFIKVTAGKKLRKFIGDENLLNTLIYFGSEQVFENKTTYTCILVLSKIKNHNFKYISIDNLKNWKIKDIDENSFSSEPIAKVQKDNWVLIPPHLTEVYNQILEKSVLLKDLVGTNNVNNGIQTSKNPIYIHFYSKVKEDDDYYYINKDAKEWKIEKELTKPYYQTVRTGADKFYTYRNVEANSFVIFPYILNENQKASLVDINKLEKDYNGLYQYFKNHETKLKERNISPKATENNWYKFGRSQHLSVCTCPEKIIVGVLSNGFKYSIDYNNTFVTSGGTAGYCMIKVPENFNYSIYYIQALLSSKYLEWLAFWYGEIFKGNFTARGTKILTRLPIIKINFSNLDEKSLHDKIASTQKQLNDLQTEIDTNYRNNRKMLPLQSQFDSQNKHLDEALKSLYNLGESDILIPQISEIYATD